MLRRDHDGIQDNYDNCEFTPNADQLDTDDDNIGKQLIHVNSVLGKKLRLIGILDTNY